MDSKKKPLDYFRKTIEQPIGLAHDFERNVLSPVDPTPKFNPVKEKNIEQIRERIARLGGNNEPEQGNAAVVDRPKVTLPDLIQNFVARNEKSNEKANWWGGWIDSLKAKLGLERFVPRAERIRENKMSVLYTILRNYQKGGEINWRESIESEIDRKDFLPLEVSLDVANLSKDPKLTNEGYIYKVVELLTGEPESSEKNYDGPVYEP